MTVIYDSSINFLCRPELEVNMVIRKSHRAFPVCYLISRLLLG